MSYILDALKKAEFERKMGSVPDVHAQAEAGSASGEPTPVFGRLWRWGLLAVFTAVFAVFAWIKLWPTRIDQTSALNGPESNTASQGQGSTMNPAQEFGATIMQPAQKSVNFPAAQTSAPAPAHPNPGALAATKAARPLEHIEKAAETPSSPVPPTVLSNKHQEGNGVSAPPSERTVPEAQPQTINELPESVRRDIPAIVFGGYLYTANPADRTVLVNNRLLHEGDQIAPNLTLEKITQKEAILNYMGYRYRVPY